MPTLMLMIKGWPWVSPWGRSSPCGIFLCLLVAGFSLWAASPLLSKDEGAGLSLTQAQRLGEPSSESGLMSLPFEIQNVAVSSGEQNKAQFSGLPTGGYPGRPQLPCQTIRILLPPDAIPQTVTLSISNPVSQVLEGDWTIAPAPPIGGPDGIPRWPSDVTIVNGMDQTVYSQNLFYPPSHYDFLVSGQWREYKIVSVAVYPYRYNPATRKLVFLSQGEIQVRYQREPPGAAVQSMNVRPASQAARCQQLAVDCINFAATAPLYVQTPLGAKSAVGTTTNYAIITTSAITGQTSALTNFIAVKAGLGFTACVITEAATADGSHYVSGSSCDQRADNIRSWLAGHYASLGIEYVLLVGNPHPTSFNSASSIPMKMCYPRYGYGDAYTNSPTDMYYAELTGTWDNNTNGVYGEYADVGSGGIDMLCEVDVGRIPVYDTGAAQIGYLNSILNKTVQYETSTNTSWRTNCLGAAGFLDDSFTCDGAEMIESFRTNVCAPNRLSVLSLYQQGSRHVSCDSIYPSAYELRGMAYGSNDNHVSYHWQNKDYGAVIWWGHGADTWTQVGPSAAADGVLFTNSSASALDNSHPSFLFATSCNNGYPETTSNLCVSVLRNGGMGVLSSSRVSWYALAVWQPSYFALYSDNASYNYNAASRMISRNETIGQAINWVHRNGGLGWMGPSLMNHFDFNIYGDPSASLFTNQPAAITSDPQSRTNNPGTAASFTVGASGTAPLYYQWQKDNANIGSATNATYTINSVTNTDAGNYRCIVSNIVPGAVTSLVASLTVNAPAAITFDPQSRTNNPGTAASFTVGASGTAPLYYQWQKNSLNIGLATSSIYTINSVAAGDAGNYRCIISNMVNSATSAVAVLTVNTNMTVINDYDGDGKSDLAVYKDGYWSIFLMSIQVLLDNAGVWGGTDWTAVPGDYDGDVKSDLAIYQNGYWSIISIANGVTLIANNVGPYGGPGWIPVPGDYDGDGKSDLAAYKDGYWTIYSLANGYILNNAGVWGGAGWTPVPGDYNGDGKSDLAVYNNGYWSIISIANPVTVILNNAGVWGGAGWTPVPGDYDGDSKSDLCVYNNGYWSIFLMKIQVLLNNAGVWGGPGWIPVSGDYDADGKSDLAVYKNGYWSIYSIQNGVILNNAGVWGGTDWTPVQ